MIMPTATAVGITISTIPVPLIDATSIVVGTAVIVVGTDVVVVGGVDLLQGNKLLLVDKSPGANPA